MVGSGAQQAASRVARLWVATLCVGEAQTGAKLQQQNRRRIELRKHTCNEHHACCERPMAKERKKKKNQLYYRASISAVRLPTKLAIELPFVVARSLVYRGLWLRVQRRVAGRRHNWGRSDLLVLPRKTPRGPVSKMLGPEFKQDLFLSAFAKDNMLLISTAKTKNRSACVTGLLNRLSKQRNASGVLLTQRVNWRSWQHGLALELRPPSASALVCVGSGCRSNHWGPLASAGGFHQGPAKGKVRRTVPMSLRPHTHVHPCVASFQCVCCRM